MPSKSFGSFMDIKAKQLVANTAEIPKSQWAYVVNASTLEYDTIGDREWEAFLAGDMSKFKEAIEKSLPNTHLEWVNFVWDRAEKIQDGYNLWEMRWMNYYHVYGFKCEAIVKNISGGLTGLEIVAIIIAVVIGIAILSLIALGVWITFQVMAALQQAFGPAGVAIGGLIILGGIGALLFVIFGGKAQYKGKKRAFRLGKGES